MADKSQLIATQNDVVVQDHLNDSIQSITKIKELNSDDNNSNNLNLQVIKTDPD